MPKYVTAINCMDGRVQLPVINWMKEQFSAEYVDMITEPGPNKILLYGSSEEINRIKEKIKISHERHESKVVAVVGHYDCAGHPISRERKIEKIIHSVDLIDSWEFDMQVLGLYVNDKWEVEVIKMKHLEKKMST